MAENEIPEESESRETERKATEMGWLPKSEWKGNPDNWVDAAEFVKKGETFIPFLQHERKKLRGELDVERQARQRLEQDLAATRENVESLKAFNTEMEKERLSRRKAEIGQELKVAREAGDDVKVAELQNELGEVVKPQPKPNGSEQPRQPAQPQIQPWVKEFIEGNEDFFKNGRKVALFNAVMLEKRQAGDARVGPEEGTALLNEARDEVERTLSVNFRRQAPSRTEESRSGGGGRTSSGTGYADLPPEARDKCDQQETKFVGERKAFKTQSEWRKHFTSEYFGPSAVVRGRGE